MKNSLLEKELEDIKERISKLEYDFDSVRQKASDEYNFCDVFNGEHIFNKGQEFCVCKREHRQVKQNDK